VPDALVLEIAAGVEDAQSRPQRLRALGEIEAIEIVRHHNVGEEEVDLALPLQDVEGLTPARGLEHCVAELIELADGHGENVGIIVDHEDLEGEGALRHCSNHRTSRAAPPEPPPCRGTNS